MRYKLIIGITAAFLLGIALGALFVYFKYESKPLWLLPVILIFPIIIYYFLYNKLIKPYLQILSGMKLLNEQDFSTRIRPVKNKEALEMANVFNRMMEILRNERLSVREKNRFLDLLIQASPQGIIVLDFNERITDINTSGQRLLGISSFRSVKGKTLKHADFELAHTLADMGRNEDIIVRNSGITILRCIRSSFVDQGFEHPFILIEELTRELLQVEKESYERIIRMMSHEVNNSVGAIGATLNVVSDIIRVDEKNEWNDLLPAVEASSERCKHLAQFISNLAHVVKLPEPSRSQISLNEQVRAVNALTHIECRQRNINLTLSLDNKDTFIYVDGIQFEQVLVNIIKNAYESINADGEIRIITRSFPRSITIEDNGPGIPEDIRQKLFTSFFTTKASGQGIGLTFVRDVLINHHLKFSLNTENGWTRFVINFD